MSLVAYIPTISSDVTRFYENYDVNCQKSFGTIVATFSLLMSLYTWVGYINGCFASFYDGEIAYNSSLMAVDEDQVESNDIEGYADFDWTPHSGFICIIVATLLKIPSIVAHLLLPTPTITHYHGQLR